MRGMTKGLKWKKIGDEAFTIKALLICKIIVEPIA